MKTRRSGILVTLAVLVLLTLVLLASCSPAAAPSQAPAAVSPTRAPAAAEPTATTAPAAAEKTTSVAKPTAVAQPTTVAQLTAVAQPTAGALPSATAVAEATKAPVMTATESGVPAKPEPQLVEGRQIELEWPDHLRMGDSDIIRLSLVPVKDGYVAKAEFPDHALQTREVPVPRPDGYELYGLARLDGVGFDIAPTGDQERFIPEGEEVAWRWSLMPHKAGQQRLSIHLRLRWAPAAGAAGSPRESQIFARSINVQVNSFLGLSPSQAASAGFIGLLLGCGFLLAAVIAPRGKAADAPVAGLHVTHPNPAVILETPTRLALSAEESGLLRGLFASYKRVVIENEFLSGYSGARTFLVRPIRPDDCADAPTIVKLGPSEAIRQEFSSYEAFVKDRLPPMTARIQRPPVQLPQAAKGQRTGSTRAAVQYTFIAEPGHPPISLRAALLQQPDPGLLLRLFETFGPNWWMQRRPYTFRLGAEYDRLLPPHLVLQPQPGPQPPAGNNHPARILTERDIPDCQGLTAGSLISVQPFHQAELRADGQSYSLVGSPAEGRPALRLRWLAPAPPASLTLARVTATRMDLLRGWTAGFEPTRRSAGLPDPLEALPSILEETLVGTRSVIHGDLNLENVLAGPGSLVWLIDFAQTREGHPLFDFAHLESELIAHVLAAQTGSAEAYLARWLSGQDPLLNALHQIAGRCLFDPARPREYQLALFMACLGALKYPNLAPLPKECLYQTAASIVTQLLG